MEQNELIAVISGILFLIVGLILLNRYFKKKKSLNSPYSIVVEGTIVGCRAVSNSNDDSSSYSYYPEYEFYVNGERITYNSKYGFNRDKTGEKQMLCYNTQTKLVFEYNSLKKDILVAVISIVLGLFTILTIIL